MADSSSSSSQPPVPPSSQPPASSQITSQSHELPPPLSTSTLPAGGLSASAEPAVVLKREPDTTDGTALDVSIEQDIEMANTGGANEGENTVAPGGSAQDALPTSVDAIAAAVAPSKKETSLREFLGKMDEYAPIIPDAVTAHYLTLAGLPPPGNGPNQTPPHLARLLALATQKFIADIAADSYQYARIRASNSSSANNPMGSLNAASGLNVPAGAAGAGAAGGAGGVSGGDAGKGKASTHLGIQRPGFGGGGSGGSGQGRTVLTMEDLGMAVSEYGVSVKRGEFYR
ncbi:putative TFIID and and SAGA complex TAF10 subunit [Aspergillus clavatus NRRL 1]|uniref:TFIID and and SAGA complex TAF10 subunit, putative n=1 Tax=Aspergillus clavatus (strain ATCC 1007 / CBS 513.65 / DSM 816 / NCTC 3887 / NRRL 1 / QM 1276 / 107) TaxID=344612 RepID=A1CBA0_ASPCL|nr:TFIID and and SAGA complex TAF10 subunit, putative [Aspergillus clavatus NRRL 1]EAW13018.1 TFIID and and SAGA complex TAF10 subunit, putative [Aspergillus clavatus NRRL 1]